MGTETALLCCQRSGIRRAATDWFKQQWKRGWNRAGTASVHQSRRLHRKIRVSFIPLMITRTAIYCQWPHLILLQTGPWVLHGTHDPPKGMTPSVRQAPGTGTWTWVVQSKGTFLLPSLSRALAAVSNSNTLVPRALNKSVTGIWVVLNSIRGVKRKLPTWLRLNTDFLIGCLLVYLLFLWLPKPAFSSDLIHQSLQNLRNWIYPRWKLPRAWSLLFTEEAQWPGTTSLSCQGCVI